jgi:hypothetical protein
MIIRGGIPKPIRGTAPAVPGGPLADENALAAFHFLVDCKTVWIRIDNVGGVPLRIFPQKPSLDPSRWTDYYELPNGQTLEGWFEFTDMWFAGVGGTCAFKALLGLRVL